MEDVVQSVQQAPRGNLALHWSGPRPRSDAAAFPAVVETLVGPVTAPASFEAAPAPPPASFDEKSSDVVGLPWQRVPRPMWPMEAPASYRG